MRLQTKACWLMRGLVVTCVAFVAPTWAQSGGSQGNASPPKAAVAPPPADLEPGVNTSATQPSSDTAPAPIQPEHSGGNPEKRQRRDAGQPTKPVGKGAAAPTTTGGGAGGGATTGAGARAGGAAESAPGATGAPGGSTTAAAPAGTAPGASATTTGRTAAAPKTGAPAGKAQDRIELDTTQITGNRELPKVLYIVPWKRSDLGDLVGKPVNSLLDEVLAPVDRDVFKRQNRYYDALKPDAAKDAAGAATGPEKR